MLEYTVRPDLDFGKNILTEKDIKSFYKLEDSKATKAVIKQLIELGYIYESDKNTKETRDTK